PGPAPDPGRPAPPAAPPPRPPWWSCPCPARPAAAPARRGGRRLVVARRRDEPATVPAGRCEPGAPLHARQVASTVPLPPADCRLGEVSPSHHASPTQLRLRHHRAHWGYHPARRRSTREPSAVIGVPSAISSR